jgi:DNA-binding transcriptional MerR regulator
MDGLKISDVAAATGFTTSALRYYEDVGLLAPARSKAGYRIYDNRMIERLRFISRAKRLGLNLEEIRRLVTMWDGERCAPVADHLRRMVAEKVADTEQQIAALEELAAQLRWAVIGIDEGVTDGACGPECACHHEPAVDRDPTGEQPAPDHPAIACTLAPEHIESRVADWQALTSQALGRDPVDGGLRLRFPTGTALAREVARLAAAEQACCTFFDFTVHIGPGGTDLEVRAPAEAMVLVNALVGRAA